MLKFAKDAVKGLAIILLIVTGISIVFGNPGLQDNSRTLQLADAEPSSLEPSGNLAHAFLSSELTRLQKDQIERDIVGKVVDWNLPIKDVRQSGRNVVVHTSDTLTYSGPQLDREAAERALYEGKFRPIKVAETTVVLNKNDQRIGMLDSKKVGDALRVKGVINGVSFGVISIDPAIIMDDRPSDK